MKQLCIFLLLLLICQVLAQNQNGNEDKNLGGRFEEQKEALLKLHNKARLRLRKGRVRDQPRARRLKKLVSRK